VAALALAALIGCGGDEPLPVLDAEGRALDPATGLVVAEGWELVAMHCTGCHSAQQFLRQRGTRQTWQSIIDWMQRTQGLWQFPAGVEERIVDYLAAEYAPKGSWRRAPIPPELMPPNPYAVGGGAAGAGTRRR
jgi:hypothetical protein